MATITLAIGPTTSGKTTWLKNWQAEKPDEREVVDELGNLWKAIQSGKDVGVAVNGTFTASETVPTFGTNEIQIVSFNA